MSLTGFSVYPMSGDDDYSDNMDTFISEIPTLVTELNALKDEPAKARGVLGVSGNIIESFNVASITDGGTGIVTVTLDTDFSNANYTIVATAQSSNIRIVDVYGTPAVGSFILRCYVLAASLVDPTYWHFACFGTM